MLKSDMSDMSNSKDNSDVGVPDSESDLQSRQRLWVQFCCVSLLTFAVHAANNSIQMWPCLLSVAFAFAFAFAFPLLFGFSFAFALGFCVIGFTFKPRWSALQKNSQALARGRCATDARFRSQSNKLTGGGVVVGFCLRGASSNQFCK
jgi:hypothetical protein